jgi:hypothetical protein
MRTASQRLSDHMVMHVGITFCVVVETTHKLHTDAQLMPHTNYIQMPNSCHTQTTYRCPTHATHKLHTDAQLMPHTNYIQMPNSCHTQTTYRCPTHASHKLHTDALLTRDASGHRCIKMTALAANAGRLSLAASSKHCKPRTYSGLCSGR